MTARTRKKAISFLVMIVTIMILLFGSAAVAQAPESEGHSGSMTTQELAIESALSGR